MVLDVETLLEERLLMVLAEMDSQIKQMTACSSPGESPLVESLAQMREYIQCDEKSLAYEVVVATLEKYPFLVSGRSAVALLEIGLIMQYKTDREEDAVFDHREGMDGNHAACV